MTFLSILLVFHLLLFQYLLCTRYGGMEMACLDLIWISGHLQKSLLQFNDAVRWIAVVVVNLPEFLVQSA